MPARGNHERDEKRLTWYGGDRQAIALANAASRLSRAFTSHRLKRGHTQVIRIAKVEVQPGAQAIVGSVQRSLCGA